MPAVNKSKKDAKAIQKMERANEVLKYRIAGASFEEIGARIGCSRAEAHRRFKLAMASLEKLNENLIEDVKAIELRRLDSMFGKFFLLAVREGDKAAAKICLDVMKRRAAMLGLDEAQVVKSVDGTDEILFDGASGDSLERYRAARADKAEIEVAQMRGELVAVSIIRDKCNVIARQLRSAQRQLDRIFGADAGNVVRDALAACAKDAPQLFDGTNG